MPFKKKSIAIQRARVAATIKAFPAAIEVVYNTDIYENLQHFYTEPSPEVTFNLLNENEFQKSSISEQSSSIRNIFKANIKNDPNNRFKKGDLVYIKQMPICEPINRFNAYQEVILGYQLKHENIVQLTDNWAVLNSQTGLIKFMYFVTEDVGQNLAIHKESTWNYSSKKKAKSKLSYDTWRKIFFDNVNSLAYLKSKAVLHRNIKPESITLKNGDSGLASVSFLGEFGWDNEIFDDGSEIRNDTVKNSPEVLYQKIENVNFQSDIFQLGLTMLEITGPGQTNFFKSLRTESKLPKSGNHRYDEAMLLALFLACSEKDHEYTSEQKNEIFYPEFLDSEKFEFEFSKEIERLTKFLEKNYTTFDPSRKVWSIGKTFIFNHFMRKLDQNLGWDDKNKEEAVDILIEMMHFYGNSRPTVEQLLKNRTVKRLNLGLFGGCATVSHKIDTAAESKLDLINDENVQYFITSILPVSKSLFTQVRQIGTIASGGEILNVINFKDDMTITLMIAEVGYVSVDKAIKAYKHILNSNNGTLQELKRILSISEVLNADKFSNIYTGTGVSAEYTPKLLADNIENRKVLILEESLSNEWLKNEKLLRELNRTNQNINIISSSSSKNAATNAAKKTHRTPPTKIVYLLAAEHMQFATDALKAQILVNKNFQISFQILEPNQRKFQEDKIFKTSKFVIIDTFGHEIKDHGNTILPNDEYFSNMKKINSIWHDYAGSVARNWPNSSQMICINEKENLYKKICLYYVTQFMADFWLDESKLESLEEDKIVKRILLCLDRAEEML